MCCEATSLTFIFFLILFHSPFFFTNELKYNSRSIVTMHFDQLLDLFNRPMAEKEQKDGEKGHTGRWKFRWTKSSSWTCCDDQEKNNLICSLYIREEAKQMGFIVGAAVRGMEGSNILDGEIESINSAQGIVVKWSNGTTTGMCYTPEKLQRVVAARDEQATEKARQMGFIAGGAVLGIFSNNWVKGKIFLNFHATLA
jgi:hypothetical protein